MGMGSSMNETKIELQDEKESILNVVYHAHTRVLSWATRNIIKFAFYHDEKGMAYTKSASTPGKTFKSIV